jgi:hypothetical protein
MRPPIAGMNEICLPDPKPQQYRHLQLEERIVGDVIFGRIMYKDIFRKERYSTFALLIQPEHTDTITMSFADDWS